MQINIQPVTIYPHVANMLQIDAVKIRNIGIRGSAIILCSYISTNGQPVSSATVDMPTHIYDQWGTDDTYVINYTLSELGLSQV